MPWRWVYNPLCFWWVTTQCQDDCSRTACFYPIHAQPLHCFLSAGCSLGFLVASVPCPPLSFPASQGMPCLFLLSHLFLLRCSNLTLGVGWGQTGRPHSVTPDLRSVLSGTLLSGSSCCVWLWGDPCDGRQRAGLLSCSV